MSDHNDLEDARRSLGQNVAVALQVGAQLFTAYVQLRLLALRRAEAQAVEAAEQAAQAAEAAAAAGRAAYAHDRQHFANLHDPDWWDQASPEDIQEAAEAAMRWSTAAPEAAAAARAAAEGLRERDLEDVVDIDVDALANARVDPAMAREFAAMQTGSRTTSTRAAETDPNAQVVADAFGPRADEFLYQPMWDKLSAAIDRAVEDGRFDVVSLLREGDAWRPYHAPDDPDAARRDPAGLLAWRLEDYLDGDPQHPTRTWDDDRGRQPMRPRDYSETVIDGEIIDEGSDDPPAAATTAEQHDQADYLNEHWPPAAARRLIDSEQWPQMAASLAHLRRDGADVAAGLLGPDGSLDERTVTDPDAAYVLVFDPAHPDRPPTVAARGGQPHPDTQEQPQDPAAPPVNPDHEAMAAHLAEGWSEHAERMTGSRRWSEAAERLCRVRDDGVDVTAYLNGLKVDWDEVKDPAAYLIAVIDRNPPKPPTPADTGPQLPPIADRHQRIVEVMREKWPDSAESVITSRRWPRIERVFDDLTAKGTDVVAVIESVPLTLADKDVPAAYLEKVLTNAHKEHRRRGAGRAPEAARPPEPPRPDRIWHVGTDGKTVSAAPPPAFRSLMAAVGPMQDGKRRIVVPVAPIRTATSLESPTQGTER